MTIPLLLLAAAFLLILANGFFVAAEFGLVTVERPGRRAGRRRGRPPGPHASSTRCGSCPSSSPAPSSASPSPRSSSACSPSRRSPSCCTARSPRPALPDGAVSGVAVVVGMLLASAVQMVIGELVPKNWAVSRPLQVARFVAGPQHALLRRLPAGDPAAQRRRQPARPRPRRRARRGAGLRPYPRRTGLPGPALGPGRRPGAGHRRPVRTHPLPGRTDRAARDDPAREGQRPAGRRATAEDVLNLTRATGLSRFPVYRERIDEIVGMVHLKDALAVPAARAAAHPGRPASRAPPLLVPETLPVQPLLERLRSEQPIAVVVDEYGGTAGVVTLEDIVEELVGEVRDEHDDARPARARRRSRPRTAAPPGTPTAAAASTCCGASASTCPRGRTRRWRASSPTCSAASPPPATRAELPGWRLVGAPGRPLPRRTGPHRADRRRRPYGRAAGRVQLAEAAR